MSASIDNLTLETEDLFDLSCPGCNADLLADETYATFRVCGTCNRHFWISARERIALLEQTGKVELGGDVDHLGDPVAGEHLGDFSRRAV